MPKLILSHPLTPYGLNQGWGVNGAYYQANGINIKGHNGLDLRAYHGQPIYASHDGTAFYEIDDSQGHGVVIISDKPYDYKGGLSWYKTIYWHMVKPMATYPQLVQNGQSVKRGQQIGWADSTGLSSGDHCHFGLKPITNGKAPLSGDAPDLNIGAWVNQEPNNGFLGAVDPTPYFDGSYAHNPIPTVDPIPSIVQTVATITNEVASLPIDQQKAVLPSLKGLVDSLVAYLKSIGRVK